MSKIKPQTFKDVLLGFINPAVLNTPEAQKSIQEAVDQLEIIAANIYAHPTRDGWCCACDGDVAFALKEIQAEPEYQKMIRIRELNFAEKELTAIHRSEGKDLPKHDYDNSTDESIDDRLEEIKVEREKLQGELK